MLALIENMGIPQYNSIWKAGPQSLSRYLMLPRHLRRRG